MKTRKTPGTALVTGGARRIGRAICLMLAARGYNIALNYHHSKDEAEELAQEIAGHGVSCKLFKCDLTAEKDVLVLLEKVHAQFPDLHILVNNASIFTPSKFDRKDYKLIDDNYTIHVKAPFILSAEFARLCGSGQIINMLDTKIAQHKTTHVAYLISKKALHALTELSAIEFAPRIRVNGVAPGPILAPPGKNGDYIKKRGQEIPLKKQGDVGYVTKALEFLIDNDFVTGQVIFADGGEHLV